MGGIVRAIASIGAVVVGTVLGGPIGGAIGGAIFGLLFPQEVPEVSSSISDLMKEGVEYSKPYRRIYGLMEMKGDIVDCGIDPGTGELAGIEEDGDEAFLRVAYLLCEGVAYVEKIVEDNDDGTEVIWDRFNAEDGTMPDPASEEWITFLEGQFSGDDEYRPGAGITMTPAYAPDGTLMAELSENLRLYAGTEYQLPDTALVAIHGADTTPAHRGDCYVVFNRYGPLKGSVSHTFHVRSMITGKREIIRREMLDSSVPPERIWLTSIEGDVDGIAVTQVQESSQLIQNISATAFHDVMYMAGSFMDASRLNPATWVLRADELGGRVIAEGAPATGDDIQLITTNIKGWREKPSQLVLQFLDINDNYEQNEAPAVRNSADYENIVTIDMAIAGTLDGMTRLADIMLDEIWAAQGTEKFTLMPGRSQVAPGNLLIIDPEDGTGIRQLRVTLADPDPSTSLISIEAVSHDLGVYGIHRVVEANPRPRPTVPFYETPTCVLMDLPALTTEMQSVPGWTLAAAVPTGTPWKGAAFFSTRLGDAALQYQASVGELMTDYEFTEAEAAVINTGHVYRVGMMNDVLETVEDADVMNGANLMAIIGAEGLLLVSFVTATPVPGGAGQFDLSGIWPGRYGTDGTQSIAAGAKVVLLRDSNAAWDTGLKFLPQSLTSIGRELEYEVQAAADLNKTTGTLTATLNGNNLRPARVTGVTKVSDGAGGYKLRFHPRTRDWDAAEAWWVTGQPPREIDPRRYTIALRDGADEVDRRVVTWPDASSYPVEVTYTAAELTTIFGSVPDTLTGSIWHEGTYLKGQERSFEA